jgi:methyl-accepting chemotaxis protein
MSMASFAENGRDVFSSPADSYVRYAFAAQQEFFELGMSLLTRQLHTGQRIIGARDLGEAFAACSDLLKASAEDFSSTATRLLDRASDTGRAVVEETAESVRDVAVAASEVVQKVDEVVEKSEQVVRASVRRRRRSQAAVSGDETPPTPVTPGKEH